MFFVKTIVIIKFNNELLHMAVKSWCTNKSKNVEQYGHSKYLEH